MSVILSALSFIMLYIRRFGKDFDEEQVSIFMVASAILVVLVFVYIWLSNRA